MPVHPPMRPGDPAPDASAAAALRWRYRALQAALDAAYTGQAWDSERIDRIVAALRPVERALARLQPLSDVRVAGTAPAARERRLPTASRRAPGRTPAAPNEETPA